MESGERDLGPAEKGTEENASPQIVASVDRDQKPSHQDAGETGVSQEIQSKEPLSQAGAFSNGDDTFLLRNAEPNVPREKSVAQDPSSEPTTLPQGVEKLALRESGKDPIADEVSSQAIAPSGERKEATPGVNNFKPALDKGPPDAAALDTVVPADPFESLQRTKPDEVEKTARSEADHQPPRSIETSMKEGETVQLVSNDDLAKVRSEGVVEDLEDHEAKGNMQSRRNSQLDTLKPRPSPRQVAQAIIVTDDRMTPPLPQPPPLVVPEGFVNGEREPQEEIVEVIEEPTPPTESENISIPRPPPGREEPERWEEGRARERSRLRRAKVLDGEDRGNGDAGQPKEVDGRVEERRQKVDWNHPTVQDIPERALRHRTSSAGGLPSTTRPRRSPDRRRPHSDIHNIRSSLPYEPLPVRRPPPAPPLPPSVLIRRNRSPSPPMYRRSESDIGGPPTRSSYIYPIEESREHRAHRPRRVDWDYSVNNGRYSVSTQWPDRNFIHSYPAPLHRDPYSFSSQRSDRDSSDLYPVSAQRGSHYISRPRSDQESGDSYFVPIERERKPYSVPIERERKPYSASIERERIPYSASIERERKPYSASIERERIPYSASIERERNSYSAPTERERIPYSASIERERTPYAASYHNDSTRIVRVQPTPVEDKLSHQYSSPQQSRVGSGRDDSNYFPPPGLGLVRRDRSNSRDTSADGLYDVNMESRPCSGMQSPVHRDIPSPVLPLPSLQRDVDSTESSEWITYLKSKSLLPTRQEEINWSGKGQHVEFSKLSEVPLVAQKPLGHSANCLVEQCRFQRYLIARKTIQCSRRMTKEQALIEVEHLQRLSHPHIVQLIGSYVLGKKFAILLFPAADFNLEEFMEMCGGLEAESLERTSLLSFTSCLLSALAYVHDERIKHMDIKPKNILVRSIMEPLEPYRIYLADFGIAKSYKVNEDMETNGITAFTRTYAAPEVALQETRGTKADIFSLGCVFSEIFTVLSDKTLESFVSSRQGGNDDDDSAFHSNLERVILWLAGLNPSDTSGLLSWPQWFSVIKQMLQEDASDRPSAADLLREFKAQKDCCRGKPASFDPNYHRPRPQERQRLQDDPTFLDPDSHRRKCEWFKEREESYADPPSRRERMSYDSDSRRSRMRRHEHASYDSRRPMSGRYM
ncbi:MAG: hypothetical protein M1812_007050 [Candelaria pacifica]|nr:MAG: hypothetical protein M1812_007050 [Candelaria pacifica]